MNNFHPLEVVGSGSDTQLQVDENLNSITRGLEMQIIVEITKPQGYILQQKIQMDRSISHLQSIAVDRSHIPWLMCSDE